MSNSYFVPNVMDIEASGFGKGSYPIEVGLALEDGKGYCSLIRPESEWSYWDANAEQVHGISRDILLEYSQPLTDVARQLNEILAGETVYSDAWGMDRTWLAILFEFAGIPQGFKLEALTNLFFEDQFDIWNPTKEQVVQEMNLRRHRASSDARVIQQTFLRTRSLLADQSA